MQNQPYTSYNRYFLIPFCIWVLVGGIMVYAIDRQTIFSLANTHHSVFTDVAMVYITKMGEGVFSTIILLLLLGVSSLRNWWYFVAALLSNVLPSLLTQLIKTNVNAPRPLKYFNEAEWIHILPDWPRYMERSFPSGHTCAAFSLFTFLALLLPPKYKAFGLLFFVLALLVGYSRMYLAVHFFHDIYVGSLIGTIFTLVVVAIMNRYRNFFFRG